ncbi:hypothetical protein KP509_35G064600 [Ceratopteris richardii]|nr:hypothetical protein KP509_35G064600 [Ceratopteris richardii]
MSLKCQGDFTGSDNDEDNVGAKGECGVEVSSAKTIMMSANLNQTSNCSTVIISDGDDGEVHVSHRMHWKTKKTSTTCSITKTLNSNSSALVLMTTLTTNCSSISRTYKAGTLSFYKCCIESSTDVTEMVTEKCNNKDIDQGLLSPFMVNDAVLL